MEERALPSAVTTKRASSVPANYVSLRQLEEKYKRAPPSAVTTNTAPPSAVTTNTAPPVPVNYVSPRQIEEKHKRAPPIPPNYVSLRHLQEQHQKRKEEEAQKAKEEEDRRRLEMMMRELEEAEKEEAERVKRLAEGGERDRSQDRRHRQKCELGDRGANQRRWGDKWKGKPTPPTWVAQPAGSGRRRPEVQANAHPDPSPPTAAHKERECEGNEKMDTAEDSQVETKQGRRKKGKGQFHRHDRGKKNASAESGEPALKSTAKEEAAASTGLCAGAVAEIATRLNGALTLAPAVIMKEEEAPLVPAKSDPLPARKGARRGRRRDGPMNLPQATRQDGPPAPATELGMRPEAVSATSLERNRAPRGDGFRNRHVEREAYVADKGEADSGMSSANASLASEKQTSEAAPEEGRSALRGGGRGRRQRGRGRADGGVLWVRSPSA